MQGLINTGPRHQAKGMRLVREEGRDSGVQDVAANKCKERKTCLHSCLGPDSGMPVLKPGCGAQRRSRASSGHPARCTLRAKLSRQSLANRRDTGIPHFPGFPGQKQLAPPPIRVEALSFASWGLGRGRGGPCSVQPSVFCPHSLTCSGLGQELQTRSSVRWSCEGSGQGSRRGFFIQDV